MALIGVLPARAQVLIIFINSVSYSSWCSGFGSHDKVSGCGFESRKAKCWTKALKFKVKQGQASFQSRSGWINSLLWSLRLTYLLRFASAFRNKTSTCVTMHVNLFNTIIYQQSYREYDLIFCLRLRVKRWARQRRRSRRAGRSDSRRRARATSWTTTRAPPRSRTRGPARPRARRARTACRAPTSAPSGGSSASSDTCVRATHYPAISKSHSPDRHSSRIPIIK